MNPLLRLTKKQKKVFTVIVNHNNKYGDYPSLRVIRDIIDRNISHIAINFRVKALVIKGYLANVGGKYVPTTEGLEQIMHDSGDVARLKITNK